MRRSDDEIAFVVPGRLDQLTGGYLFDRRIVEGLRARGRSVRVIELSQRADTARLAALPDETATVVDGLALADHAELMIAQARRLRLIAFIHGPLAQETGLSPGAATSSSWPLRGTRFATQSSARTGKRRGPGAGAGFAVPGGTTAIRFGGMP